MVVLAQRSGARRGKQSVSLSYELQKPTCFYDVAQVKNM